jgi:putative addiction module component (TIGR02574 family)
MTRIEKAVKIVSDLCDFYRQIPKISEQDTAREEKYNEALPSEQKGDPMNPDQLEAEIMKLNLDARAKLAERIILSLDAPSDEENLGLWVLEAERRLKDLRAGKAKEVPAEEVFRKARAAILCGE